MSLPCFRHQCAVELSIIYVIVGALPNVVGDYCLSGNYQVGVRCIECENIIIVHKCYKPSSQTASTPSTSCYDGDIRLENATYIFVPGGYSYGGRVEICFNGTYHPVCDDGWTYYEATVACNNIGYSSDYFCKYNTYSIVCTIYISKHRQMQRPLGSNTLVYLMKLQYCRTYAVMATNITSNVMGMNFTTSTVTTA